MKGYRTIIVNVGMIVVAIGAAMGIDIPPESIEKIATGFISVMGVVNLFLRAMTDTKMGSKE